MWVVRLSDKQLEVLKALLRSEDHLGPALSRALESLELARWDELPDAQLPWQEITKRAGEQGISEADVVWDLCGLRDRHKAAPQPAKSSGKGKPRRAASSP
jgi:hypothetical protein